MCNKFQIFTAIFAVLLASGAYADEDEKPNFKEDNLTGDWGGARTKMYDAGLDVGLVYTADAMSNVSGGLKRRGALLDNTDLTFKLDGDKAYNLKGSTVFLYILNNNKGNPNKYVGSIQGVNNIEVDKSTAKVLEAWLEQNFMDDAISIKAGLYNLNSEFYVNESAALFLNSTYGIGTEFAQSGVNGPSIFPTTSLAARLKLQPTKKTYMQVAVLDGVPGDPNNPKGTHILLKKKDGVLLVGEAGYDFDVVKLGLGGWHYTEKADDVFIENAKHRNAGMYAIAEKEFSKRLSGFARVGFADKNVNQTEYAWAAGINLKDLIKARPDGIFGLAASGAINSKKYKNSQIAAGNMVDSAETQFELTYSDNLMQWLTIQPDVQYTMNPGTDGVTKNSWLIGIRAKVNF
ncbi:MAG: carbohydrate porin [Candidatus Jidaibacter sp.]|jgi:porin|nr:carbohydrate porin [Candidatus Jidaibacter sp.]